MLKRFVIVVGTGPGDRVRREHIDGECVLRLVRIDFGTFKRQEQPFFLNGRKLGKDRGR